MYRLIETMKNLEGDNDMKYIIIVYVCITFCI